MAILYLVRGTHTQNVPTINWVAFNQDKTLSRIEGTASLDFAIRIGRQPGRFSGPSKECKEEGDWSFILGRNPYSSLFEMRDVRTYLSPFKRQHTVNPALLLARNIGACSQGLAIKQTCNRETFACKKLPRSTFNSRIGEAGQEMYKKRKLEIRN
ncbi:hypothetical protein PAAG_12670 [Paracoccidioides lutzii Pb01]|uniref:Uncharacterized protein n=1 Tax=Paracoccidioides lutzii (strain ATCC MYA-826 / Pb01) TaxID=502779 RepID=A0A0A2V2V4_PARBA|nr:hypothetical protein PAAG_12670 [Paracoccidioides lutzii Pb01]KGQ00667.1 hypothetical protein PAAG_12670 [Paracoccidioides lutzii Pb01]